MNVLLLLSGQVLALALGAGFVALLTQPAAGATAIRAGYGYVLGSVAVTIVLRALSAAGVRWNLFLPSVIIAALAMALWAAAYVRKRSHASSSPAPSEVPSGAVFWLFVALIAVHAGLALWEAWLRPLFPWDATTNWSSKARAWYEMRAIVPFVDDMTWVRSSGGVFTDAHPTYPATVPLLQVWPALAWGSWDDAVINISWPLTMVALAAGLYGGLRRLDVSATVAIACTFAVVSLPFVDVHAALAGYADLVSGTTYAFAVLALAWWTRTRRTEDLVMLLACALVLPMVKAPGWAWFGTLAVGVLSAFLSRRWIAAMIAIGIVGTAVGATIAARSGVSVMGYTFRDFSWSAVVSVFDNLYIADSWHLLGLAVPVALLLARRSFLARLHLPVGATLAAGAAFLSLIFFFTNTSDEGVTTSLTVNRALLHWVPALLAYLAWMVDDAWKRGFAPSESALAAEAPTPAASR